jgi:Pyridoxamine 5'-phosphate oxidase
MYMKLSEYFEKREGVGVLATAGAHGNVDAALYGRPHFFDDETIAFIAAEKLTHANLQSNPHAVYLFKEMD